ncbi:MAG: ABC transporter ATP-binding protein [Candidatus Latescibacteria bacterium]|nr:ABC transporter ATP-binding protein [Candidatus Latescibacterota bacterium]
MLVIKNLEAYYDRIQALKGVSLHVSKGEVVCLIGANGAGKTTTLQAVSGLIKHVEGDILLNGKSIRNLPAERIVRLGVSHAPEGRQIFAPLSVPDNLRLGAYTRKDRNGIARDIEWIFSLFPRLDERRDNLAGVLSGGEQQMLALGRALMARPKILLLDEPSMGLAPLIIKEIYTVIAQLKKEDITILLVEQNVKAALMVSDRGYVIETGRIVLSGTAEELRQSQDIQRAYLGRSVDGFLGECTTEEGS